MIGSKDIQIVNGTWDHVGYMDTEHVYIPGDTVLPRGTFLQASPTSDEKAVLASGDAIGFTTQEVDNYGHTSVNARLRAAESIGRMPGDWPMKKGLNCPVTLRRMSVNSQVEYEGKGIAAPGNTVCTSGTGALGTGTAIQTDLSVFNGCLRIAQTGDVVIARLKQTNLTVHNTAIAGRLRIRVEFVGKSVKA